MTEACDQRILRIRENVAHEFAFQPFSSLGNVTDSGAALRAEQASTQVQHADFLHQGGLQHHICITDSSLETTNADAISTCGSHRHIP